MITEKTVGTSTYAQCFTCRNAPILKTIGTKDLDIRIRVEKTAEKHERVHSTHQITVFIAELPIVRDMKERLESVRT